MKIFVGCSSSDKISKTYLNLAKDVGKRLKNHEIIIGGTEEGMMGEVVSTKKPFKRIILKDYLENDTIVSKNDIICNSSFERLKNIFENADLFLFLPGGTGALSEIFAFLEENRMKKEKKKIIILNENDYYQEIIAFIEKAKRLKFSNHNILEGLIIIDSIEELKNRVEGEMNYE